MTALECLGCNLYVVGAIQMGYDDGLIDGQDSLGYCFNQRHGPIAKTSFELPHRTDGRFDPHGVKRRSPSWWWMFREAK